MRRHHCEALRNLDATDRFERVFVSGNNAAVVQRLIPAYSDVPVHFLAEGSLRGIAQLFCPES